MLRSTNFYLIQRGMIYHKKKCDGALAFEVVKVEAPKTSSKIQNKDKKNAT